MKSLKGISIFLHDNILAKGRENKENQLLKGFVSPYSSTIAEKLLAQGVVIADKNDAKCFAELGVGIKNDNKIKLSIGQNSVSRYGVFTLSSVEQIEICAATIGDVKQVFNVIHSGMSRTPSNISLNKPKIGCINDVLTATEIKNILPVYYGLSLPEASSNLSRFDGVRFCPTKSAESLDELYKNTRTELFDFKTKRDIMLGNFMLKEDNIDVFYKRALANRAHLRNKFQELFKKFDCISMPNEEVFIHLAKIVGLPTITGAIEQQIMCECEDKLFQVAEILSAGGKK